ncbi:hypothetical protein DXG01_014494 [Tephrocybe rancida]|nr:hypothetical protein DXG01_014494 [Tephrocybe rancida]
MSSRHYSHSRSHSSYHTSSSNSQHSHTRKRTTSQSTYLDQVHYVTPEHFAQPQPTSMHPPPSALLYGYPAPSSYAPPPQSAPAHYSHSQAPSPYYPPSSSSHYTHSSSPHVPSSPYASSSAYPSQSTTHTKDPTPKQPTRSLRRSSLLPKAQAGVVVRRPERISPFELPINEALIDPESEEHDPSVERNRKKKYEERKGWRNAGYFGNYPA